MRRTDTANILLPIFYRPPVVVNVAIYQNDRWKTTISFRNVSMEFIHGGHNLFALPLYVSLSLSLCIFYYKFHSNAIEEEKKCIYGRMH